MQASISYLASWREAYSKSFTGTAKRISRYWTVYGGHRAVLTSAYFWAAVVLSAICYPLWIGSPDWTPIALSVLPSLLGFSVAALAIVLAFPGHRIFQHMAEEGSDTSYYMGLAVRLTHFIVLQVAGIGAALIAKAWDAITLNGLGFLIFGYAVMTGVSTALEFFGAARIYNAAEKPSSDDPPKAANG